MTHIRIPLHIQYTSLDTEVSRWTLKNDSPSSITTFSSNSSTSSNQSPTSYPPHAIPTKNHLHVLSPAFYSRLASHPTLHEALKSEILSSIAEENRTAQISDHGDLCALLAQAASVAQDQVTTTTKSPPSTHQKRRQHHSLSDRLWWGLISTLRRRPEPGSYPSPGHPQRRSPSKPTHPCSTPPATEAQGPTPRGHGHFLDSFVQDNCTRAEQREYQRTVLRLFLMNRFAWGAPAVLKSYSMVFRIVLAGVAIWVVSQGSFRGAG